MSYLIKQLEKATGPDEDLDEAIACLIAPPHPKHGKPIGMINASRYTASIDAALTLVPEGWQWQISNRAPEPHIGRAYLNNRELINTGRGGLTPNPKYRGAEVTAATPVIALCIAALKAREILITPHYQEKETP